ncbi:hypothetical protein BN2537_9009 [Streptomyces venezuelae]|nr:hypothetical protein BN2537_9009 [Streptomyces venezuelae]
MGGAHGGVLGARGVRQGEVVRPSGRLCDTAGRGGAAVGHGGAGWGRGRTGWIWVDRGELVGIAVDSCGSRAFFGAR